MITRRTFLEKLPLGLALLADPAPAQVGRLDGAPSRGRRAQINLWFPFQTIDFPFIDLAKMIDEPWRANGATEDHYALMDDNGYPTRMPRGASDYRAYFHLYLTDNDPWVVTWEGTGAVTLSSTDAKVSSGVSSSPNRKEVTFTSRAYELHHVFTTQIVFSGVIDRDRVRNIKVFRKSHESLLNAGQVYAPHFHDRYSGWGRIRFMDWQWTNENQQSSWASRSLPTDHSWTGSTLRKAFYCGTATQSANDYTTLNALPDSPASWRHGQQVTCKLTNGVTVKDVASFGKTKPASIGVTGHGLTTGDTIFFIPFLLSGDFNKYTSDRWFTVKVVDADNITLDGVDSSGWSGSYSGGAKICKEIRLKAGPLPFKRVVGRTGGAFLATRWTANDLRQFTYDSTFDALVTVLGPMSGGAGGVGGADTSSHSSVPLELLIDMANEIGFDPWFCIPHMASDDWVENFATLVKSRLNSNRVACIEYSNEVWNTGPGFSQTFWALNRARVLWPGRIDQHNFDFNGIHQWYGKRFHEVMSIIDKVFAGQKNRIEKVFSMWTAGFSLTSHVAPRFTAPLAGLPSTPISLADSIAIAPYCEPKRSNTANAEQVWKYKQGGSLRAEALAWLDAKWRAVDGTSWTVDYLQGTLFPTWATIASNNGVKLTQYEGGWGGIPNLNSLTARSWNGDSLSATDRDNFFFGFYGSSYFSVIARANLDNFIAAGGEFPSQYCLVAGWGSSGMWGMIHNNIFGSVVPAYAVLRSFNAGQK